MSADQPFRQQAATILSEALSLSGVFCQTKSPGQGFREGRNTRLEVLPYPGIHPAQDTGHGWKVILMDIQHTCIAANIERASLSTFSLKNICASFRRLVAAWRNTAAPSALRFQYSLTWREWSCDGSSPVAQSEIISGRDAEQFLRQPQLDARSRFNRPAIRRPAPVPAPPAMKDRPCTPALSRARPSLLSNPRPNIPCPCWPPTIAPQTPVSRLPSPRSTEWMARRRKHKSRCRDALLIEREDGSARFAASWHFVRAAATFRIVCQSRNRQPASRTPSPLRPTSPAYGNQS